MKVSLTFLVTGWFAAVLYALEAPRRGISAAVVVVLGAVEVVREVCDVISKWSFFCGKRKLLTSPSTKLLAAPWVVELTPSVEGMTG